MVQPTFAGSFADTVDAYGGPAAFDIILVQDCSVLDHSAGASLDQAYNAKLCSADEESALTDVTGLLHSKGFNSVQIALSTTGAQVRPDSSKSASDIRDIYADPGLSETAREAYIATLRRIARGIDVDAGALAALVLQGTRRVRVLEGEVLDILGQDVEDRLLLVLSVARCCGFCVAHPTVPFQDCTGVRQAGVLQGKIAGWLSWPSVHDK